MHEVEKKHAYCIRQSSEKGSNEVNTLSYLVVQCLIVKIQSQPHNLQNKALVDGSTKILWIVETYVSEVWSAANATKNAVLIGTVTSSTHDRRKKTVCCSQHSKLQRVSGGGEKWQWRSFSPMNEEHGGELLAAYLQGRVYVVGYGEYVDTMEMLDVAADGQWSSLTSSSWSLYQPLPVGSVTSVDHQLFLSVFILLPKWIKFRTRMRVAETPLSRLHY
ncbi:unnamed protein product [Hymenolepis diminuta]|uniref:Uncharacterized protein n=1 Tax=Hymenolepis diminuta TaxID=6216 RepID=A0A564ZBM0_HYMDI|nr:unnamed protein product [Hymenolepis diminuta]